MTYWQTLQTVFTKPGEFKQLLQRSSSDTVWFYIRTTLLSVVIFMAGLSLLAGTGFWQKAWSVPTYITDAGSLYPQELEVSIEANQGVTINQELPYVVPMPEQWQFDEQALEAESGLDIDSDVPLDGSFNIAAFVSDAEIMGAADIFEQNSLFVITETTGYVVNPENGEINQFDLTAIDESFVIDQAFVDQQLERVAGHWFFAGRLYVGVMLLLVFISLSFFWLMARLVTNTFLASLGWLGQRIAYGSAALSFGKVYSLTLYAIWLPIVVSWLVAALPITWEIQGWWFALLFAAWFAYIFYLMDFAAPKKPQKKTKKSKVKKKTTKKKK